MPFTDAYGDKGWYTGEVASGSGLPHGQGTMHYCDGRVRGGFWSNGLAAGRPQNVVNNNNNNNRGGGGGGGVPPPPLQPPPMPLSSDHNNGNNQQQQQQHHRPLPPRGGGGGSSNSQGNYNSSSRGMSGNGSVSSRNSHHHHHAPPPPPQQHQQQQQHGPPPSSNSNQNMNNNGAVFNVQWTDLSGKDGYYTGETDHRGEPHGLGSLRYLDDNTVVEGEWNHGTLTCHLALNLGNNMAQSHHHHQ